MRRIAVLVAVLGALIGCSSDGGETASPTTTTPPVTIPPAVPTTVRPTPPCVTDDATAVGPAVTVGPAQWRVGTVGATAGLSPGGELLFDEPAEIDHQLDVVAASGARWVRFDLDWAYIEASPGRFDWCRPDAVVAGARQRGLDVVAVPGFAPLWASDPGLDGDDFHRAPADPADYARFVTAAVHRYAPLGVRVWELWNEPNVSAFWKPQPDVARYVEVLRAGYGAVKAVDPTATVLTGGLAPIGDEQGRSIAIDTFLRLLYQNGAAGSFDGIAVHPYSVPARPLQDETWNPFVHLPEYHQLMVDNGDGDKLLWLTEFGAPTGTSGQGQAVSEDEQVVVGREAFQAMAVWPWVGPLFWYSIRDLAPDSPNGVDNWGLLEDDLTPKPGYEAFQMLMAEVAPLG